MITDFIEKHALPDNFKLVADNFYRPLAQQIFTQFQQCRQPFFVGINGCQGSGKSTLSDYIAQYLSDTYSLNVVVMSLDDFYLPQKHRNKLAENIHPLFAKRGVPGTHSTQLLKQLLTQLKDNKSDLFIPKFNKAIDEPYPKAAWQFIDSPADIVIVEGWCWGVSAQEKSQLIEPVNSLEEQNDSEREWRNYVNQQLKEHYQPLYQLFDYWVALQAPSFDYVYRWRLEQEQKLALKLKSTELSAVMNAKQILNFIQYFQRLTEHGIKTLPLFADTTFILDKYRHIQSVQENVKTNK
jgi:D-glycerate 3-kinase